MRISEWHEVDTDDPMTILQQAEYCIHTDGNLRARDIVVRFMKNRLMVGRADRHTVLDIGMPRSFCPQECDWTLESGVLHLALARSHYDDGRAIVAEQW